MAAATVVAAASAGARAADTRPPLHWTSAPPSGAHILIDRAARPSLRVSAAAADRHAHVKLSLLGSTPVRIATRPGNPAVGVLRFPPARSLRPRTFVVTIVARLSGRHRLAVQRTVIATVRPRFVSLTGPGARSRWAYVRRPAAVRAAPSAGARAINVLPTTTSDSMPNLVRALAETRTGHTLWTKVALTILPNGRTGWVPRRVLSVYHVVGTRVVIDTKRMTLSLLRNGRRVFRAPVGVGEARWPTPRGTFYVRERLTDFHDPAFGPVAFGTSARSPTLTDWPGGGIVGIHGTNAPGLVPGRISHGCIRLRNGDILRLARLLPLGTPVEIR